MITSFKSLGQGGGGGYVLPTATDSRLGGVMIGEGINVDSAGTISVTGGTGGGVEVVTELPASGTDGQMVLLDTVIPEKHIHITGMGTNSNPTQSVTAIGITEKTFLFDYNNYSTLCPVYVNPDGSYSIYDPFLEQENIYPVGETTAYTITNGYYPSMSVTGAVTSTGCTFTVNPAGTSRQNAINDIDQNEEEKQVLYTWSDSPELTADIDYTASFTSNWCVRFKYSEIADNTTIAVTNSGNNYRHFVYKNGELRVYESASADTYTATTYTTVGKYGIVSGNYAYTYWNDSEIVMYQLAFAYLNNINIDAFYKTGWHKYLGHRVSSKAFYKDYVWYDEDYGIIIKNNSFPMYDVEFKVNPNSSYNIPYRVYSKNNSTIGPFFAPTTTGTTGYVCVAGNGWAAPTWVSPETITNGVKFWKGTQAEYDALQSYDSSTLYIITDNGNNAV